MTEGISPIQPNVTCLPTPSSHRMAVCSSASRASTVWLALHSLVRASTASREAPPPCGSEHDGEARRHGLERLQESYPLDDAQVASFRRDRHLRVAGMLPAALLVEALLRDREVAAGTSDEFEAERRLRSL